MTKITDDVPRPGSPEAQAAGCICAVLDNNHGRWPPSPPNGWWITVGCPLHSPKSDKGDEDG